MVIRVVLISHYRLFRYLSVAPIYQSERPGNSALYRFFQKFSVPEWRCLTTVSVILSPRNLKNVHLVYFSSAMSHLLFITQYKITYLSSPNTVLRFSICDRPCFMNWQEEKMFLPPCNFNPLRHTLVGI